MKCTLVSVLHMKSGEQQLKENGAYVDCYSIIFLRLLENLWTDGRSVLNGRVVVGFIVSFLLLLWKNENLDVS